MNDNSGLVFAFALDGRGCGRDLNLKGVKKWCSEDGTLWIHLDYTGIAAKDWLRDESGIDPIIVEALTAEETRQEPGSQGRHAVDSARRESQSRHGSRRHGIHSLLDRFKSHSDVAAPSCTMAIDDLRQAVETGSGPVSSGGFLEDLSDRLVLRMGAVISDVDDSVDALEDEVLTEQSFELRQKIANIRRTAISMRRYLAPQRDVMARLHNEKVDWLDDMERMRLREIADRTTRYVEDLDAIRDRATVTQEELNNRLTEQMNKTMYVLSIVAGIFLPLGLLTGLLGINVGGIPGTENKWAFTIFCILLATIASGQVWLFKRKKWM